jgi:alkylated DNA repair dioxygenase AlkB
LKYDELQPLLKNKISSSELIDSLRKLPWATARDTSGFVSRKSCWLTKDNCKCDYKYGRSTWKSNECPTFIKDICTEIALLTGKEEPNGINANWYSSVEHHLDYHADNEPLFQQEDGSALIVSLSIGSPTAFSWKENATDKEDTTILSHGDFLVMEGHTQRYYKHCVPPSSKSPHFAGAALSSVGFERFNLTFRWTCNHTARCKKQHH